MYLFIYIVKCRTFVSRSHHLQLVSQQAAELTPALQADMEVKEAIQGTIQGENGEVVQIVSSVATWDYMRRSADPGWWKGQHGSANKPSDEDEKQRPSPPHPVFLAEWDLVPSFSCSQTIRHMSTTLFFNGELESFEGVDSHLPYPHTPPPPHVRSCGRRLLVVMNLFCCHSWWLNP